MTKEQCKYIVGQIFGEEAANDDEIVQWYMDVNATMIEEVAIGFFKWNASSVSGYLDYLKRVDSADGITEKEIELNKFETATIERRFELYLQSIESK